MSDPDDWHVWLQKATNDLLNIDNNLRSAAVPWDTVCFHAQQAAEKLLKGCWWHGESSFRAPTICRRFLAAVPRPALW